MVQESVDKLTIEISKWFIDLGRGSCDDDEEDWGPPSLPSAKYSPREKGHLGLTNVTPHTHTRMMMNLIMIDGYSLEEGAQIGMLLESSVIANSSWIMRYNLIWQI